MMDNLRSLLEELDLSPSNLLRTTIYLTDYRDFQTINAVYASYLLKPFPARTTVQVAALPLGAKVQIDAVIALQEASTYLPASHPRASQLAGNGEPVSRSD